MPDHRSPHAAEIQHWLVDRLAHALHVDAATVSTSESFTDLGLSSVRAVELATELEDHLGVELSPTLIYDFPCVDELVRHVSEVLEARTVAQSGRNAP